MPKELSKEEKVIRQLKKEVKGVLGKIPFKISKDEEENEIFISVESYEVSPDLGYYMREIADAAENVKDVEVVDMESHEMIIVSVRVSE